MFVSKTFYICPTCFAASDTEPIGHPHAMICIDLSTLDAHSQCPPQHGEGAMQTRRPNWFLDATQQAEEQLDTVYGRV